MEMRVCANCNKRFDFDKGGLGSSLGGYVCGPDCAKALAGRRGTYYAIHDTTDAIVDTDAPETFERM